MPLTLTTSTFKPSFALKVKGCSPQLIHHSLLIQIQHFSESTCILVAELYQLLNVTEKRPLSTTEVFMCPQFLSYFSFLSFFFLTIKDTPFQFEKLSMYKFILCFIGTFVTRQMASSANKSGHVSLW